MNARTFARVLVLGVAVFALAWAGCKSQSEPVEPDPEPVVVATPQEESTPGPMIEEIEEGMDPAEQKALGTQFAKEAAAEINADNVAAAVAALEAEMNAPDED